MLFTPPTCQSEKTYQEENKALQSQAALFLTGIQLRRTEGSQHDRPLPWEIACSRS
jgi:hypothetical protein